MNIGAISSLASSLQSSDPTWASGGIQQSIGAAVLKQSQNADAKQAQALVKMIQEETPKPSSSGAGSIINIGA